MLFSTQRLVWSAFSLERQPNTHEVETLMKET